MSCGDGGHLVCCWGLACCCGWAELRSLVRRCICRVSDFYIGGRGFMGSVGEVCYAIGHIVCACLWYVFIMEMEYFAALSIRDVDCFCEDVSSWRKLDAFSRAGWVC